MPERIEFHSAVLGLFQTWKSDSVELNQDHPNLTLNRQVTYVFIIDCKYHSNLRMETYKGFHFENDKKTFVIRTGIKSTYGKLYQS